MTTTKQKGVYEDFVLDVQDAYKTRGTNYIHLITFRQEVKYLAEEMSSVPKSKFIPGRINKYEVKHPGKEGAPDWILFLGTVDEAGTNGTCKPVATPEDFRIAEGAMHDAVQLGIKNDWTVEKIIKVALQLAGNIKIIARKMEEQNF